MYVIFSYLFILKWSLIEAVISLIDRREQGPVYVVTCNTRYT